MKNFLITLLIICAFQNTIFSQNESQSIDEFMQKGKYAQALILLEN